jgi:hypothetical protein
MRLILALLALSALIAVGGCSKGKSSDLAQEMAVQKEIKEVKALIKQDKNKEASKKLAKIEKRFGHTKSFAKAKQRLIDAGFTTESEKIAFTGTKMMELENRLVSYKKDTGQWPAPGMIAKPLDAWDNELYWIVATPEKTYDLLIISAGSDGDPGSGDELIVIWIKNKPKSGKGAKGGEGHLSKKKLHKTNVSIMSVDDLVKMANESGEPEDKSAMLKQFQTEGEASKNAGQPRRRETIMSLDEIKTKF